MPNCGVSKRNARNHAQEVRTQHDVGKNLVLGHLDVADGDTQAENLLELELDRRADLNELVVQVFAGADGRRELASYNEPRVSIVQLSASQVGKTDPSRDPDRANAGSA